MSICLVWLAEYGAFVNTTKHLVSKRDDMHHFIKGCILGKKKSSIFNINISNYVNNYQFEPYTSCSQA
jgi:hypothetical protein